jgi:uncharacterized delta-60 repeat protein
VTQAGEIIIAGSGLLLPINELVVVRLKEDGVLDAHFGSEGVALAPFGLGPSEARSVAIDARTRILAAGFAGVHFAVARFLRNGTLDSSLNQSGMISTSFDEGVSEASVARIDSPLQERIVAAGSAAGQFALARYLENGSPDPTFGTGGKVRTVILSESRRSGILDISFDSQQRIVAAGFVATLPPID